jgi:hypothetical protein
VITACHYAGEYFIRGGEWITGLCFGNELGTCILPTTLGCIWRVIHCVIFVVLGLKDEKV